jgi:endonuclease/exonuclease/phosphatase family metal-dependent hydrolase
LPDIDPQNLKKTPDDGSGSAQNDRPLGTRTSRRWLAVFPVVLWTAGIILRLTIRDRVPLVAVLFYATPPIVLSALAFVAAGLLLKSKCRRFAAVAAISGIVCGCWWSHSSFYQHDSPSVADEFRVLFWNCRHGYHGWKSIAEEIHRVDAPLIGLVEAGGYTQKQREFWRWEFVDYDIASPGSGIVLMTRGKVVRSRLIPLARGGRCGQFEVLLDGKQLTVFVVDIKSNPFISRREPLKELTALIELERDKLTVLMGDFNVPADSAFLDDLRNSLTNAFETAGDGYAATWPLPVPVLTLDQVWVGRHLQLHGCRHLWTSFSDHRAVVTRLSILSDAPRLNTSR